MGRRISVRRSELHFVLPASCAREKEREERERNRSFIVTV